MSQKHKLDELEHQHDLAEIAYKAAEAAFGDTMSKDNPTGDLDLWQDYQSKKIEYLKLEERLGTLYGDLK